MQPTSQPSSQPSHQPTSQPSSQPISFPTSFPSVQPSTQPTSQPSAQPSRVPTGQPSSRPSSQPSSAPSRQPTGQPSGQPSNKPSGQPSQPTRQPSTQPSTRPTGRPSVVPTGQPSSQPSGQPSNKPSGQPSSRPSGQPSGQPTAQPSSRPSAQPSDRPSGQPSGTPTSQPSSQPTSRPSGQPSAQPVSRPTGQPSGAPSGQPSSQPSTHPSGQPSGKPRQTLPPSRYPTHQPTFDLKYESDEAYIKYLSWKRRFTNATSPFSFGTFYYKGLTVDGTCNDWTSFTQGQLAAPRETLDFVKISTRFQLYDYVSRTNRTQVIECARKNIIRSVMNALTLGIDYEGNCEGNSWRVYTCNDSPLLCVNCKKKCTASVVCPGSSFVINPCFNCDNYAKASGLVGLTSIPKRFYPLINATSVYNVTSTGFSVSVTLTDSGNLMCNALVGSVTLPSLSSIDQGGLKVAVNGSNEVQLRFSGLYPSSTYGLFCYTSDFANHVMPLSLAQKLLQTVATKCCRKLLVVSNPGSIPQTGVSGVQPSTFLFRLDSPPPSQSIIALQLRTVSCTTNQVTKTTSDIVASPTQFTFSNQSTTLQGSFTLQVTTIGCYLLTLSSKSGASYQALNMSVTVRNVRGNPPTPTVLSARMADTGSFLTVLFDSGTDQAASKIMNYQITFNCSLLLTNSLSASSSCFWTNTTALTMTLPSKASTTVLSRLIGSSITVKGGVVRAACVSTTVCSSYSYMTAKSVTIQAPVNPSPPTVMLSSKSEISPCDDITLDPTLSVGGSVVSWRVKGADGLTSQNLSLVESYLNSYGKSTLTTVTIPRRLLVPARTYYFTLLLTNWLSVTAGSTVTVTIAATTQLFPQISSIGSKGLYYASDSIFLFGDVSFSSCVGSGKNLTLSYMWQVFSGSTYLSQIQTTSLDPRYFRSSPYTFSASMVYTIQLVVKVVGLNAQGSVSTNIQIVPQGVSATIAGGKSRVISILDTVVLDASSSIDKDSPSSALQYTWACSIVSLQNYGGACSGFASSGGSAQSVSGKNLTAGSYSIVLTVRNSAGRQDTASVALTVVGIPLPRVTISAGSQSRYNPSDKVILNAAVLITRNNVTTVSWSCSSFPNITLQALTSTVRQFAGVGTYQMPLSFPTNVLQAGLSYTFTLAAAYAGIVGGSGQSSVTIVMNRPPQGGQLVASPTKGTAQSTSFSLIASQFTDDVVDLPLSYSF
eukprot:gene13813-15231_t